MYRRFWWGNRPAAKRTNTYSSAEVPPVTPALKPVWPVNFCRNEGSAWRERDEPRMRVCGPRFRCCSRSSLIDRSDSTAVGTIPLPASANGSITMLNARIAASTPRHEPRKPTTNRRWLGEGACSEAPSGT